MMGNSSKTCFNIGKAHTNTSKNLIVQMWWWWHIHKYYIHDNRSNYKFVWN